MITNLGTIKFCIWIRFNKIIFNYFILYSRRFNQWLFLSP